MHCMYKLRTLNVFLCIRYNKSSDNHDPSRQGESRKRKMINDLPNLLKRPNYKKLQASSFSSSKYLFDSS